MDIMKVCGVAVIAAVAASTVGSLDARLGKHAALTGGLILLLYAMGSVSGIMRRIVPALSGVGLGEGTADLAAKVTGLAFMTQTTVNICEDSGEKGLAEKVSLCGRLAIIAAALPQISALLKTAEELVNECF